MDWNSDLQALLNWRTLERLPGIVNFLLIVALAHTVAQLTWTVMPVPQLDEHIPDAIDSPSRPVRMTGSGNVSQSISRWHLFGQIRVAPKPHAVQQTANLPETRLNLTLRGVVSSSANNVAKAIIADAAGKENFYNLGALVPGGAVLQEIFSDRVILKRNDRLETLRLSKSSSGGVLGAARQTTRRPSASRRKRPSINYGNKDNKTILREYRDALINDPQSVMDLVRAQPVREHGKLIGYKIRPGRDRKLLRRFGLRSGDVVTGVNGISLDNPINGLEIMRNLTTAGQITVDIKRGGVAQSLSFQID